MTKEELEKEAEKYFKSICEDYNEEYERTGKRHYWVGFDIKNAFLASAEPREKQIQIDAEQIRALQKQNGELTDELTKKADTNHQLVEQLAKLNERCSELEITVGTLRTFSNEQAACIERLAKENANVKEALEGYKKIAKWCDKCELEKKISILLSCKNCPENKGGLICQKEYEDKCLAQKIEFIKELQKENAELKCECRRCVYTDSPCILSDYGKDKNGICDHFKDVFDELQNWKDEWQEQVQKATDEGYARTLQTMQLTKATEIIKKFLLRENDWHDKTESKYELLKQAEQFLSEVAK